MWKWLPLGRKHSPTIFHGPIQNALKAPDHLQYVDDIIMWGNIAEVILENNRNPLESQFCMKTKWDQVVCTADPAFRNKTARWMSSGPYECDQQNSCYFSTN